MDKQYQIPEGTTFKPCRDERCKQPIAFIKTENGRMMPVNEDGTPHWATCIGYKTFKRNKR